MKKYIIRIIIFSFCFFDGNVNCDSSNSIYSLASIGGPWIVQYGLGYLISSKQKLIEESSNLSSLQNKITSLENGMREIMEENQTCNIKIAKNSIQNNIMQTIINSLLANNQNSRLDALRYVEKIETDFQPVMKEVFMQELLPKNRLDTLFKNTLSDKFLITKQLKRPLLAAKQATVFASRNAFSAVWATIKAGTKIVTDSILNKIGYKRGGESGVTVINNVRVNPPEPQPIAQQVLSLTAVNHEVQTIFNSYINPADNQRLELSKAFSQFFILENANDYVLQSDYFCSLFSFFNKSLVYQLYNIGANSDIKKEMSNAIKGQLVLFFLFKALIANILKQKLSYNETKVIYHINMSQVVSGVNPEQLMIINNFNQRQVAATAGHIQSLQRIYTKALEVFDAIINHRLFLLRFINNPLKIIKSFNHIIYVDSTVNTINVTKDNENILIVETKGNPLHFEYLNESHSSEVSLMKMWLDYYRISNPVVHGNAVRMLKKKIEQLAPMLFLYDGLNMNYASARKIVHLGLSYVGPVILRVLELSNLYQTGKRLLSVPYKDVFSPLYFKSSSFVNYFKDQYYHQFAQKMQTTIYDGMFWGITNTAKLSFNVGKFFVGHAFNFSQYAFWKSIDMINAKRK